MGHHDWSWLCGGFVVEWIEGLVVMRRITCAQMVVAAIAVGCLLSPPQVLAQTTGTASAVPSSVGGLDGQCPKMQFVVVNSAADSFDDCLGLVAGVIGAGGDHGVALVQLVAADPGGLAVVVVLALMAQTLEV